MDYISHVTAYQRHKEYLRAMSKLDSFFSQAPDKILSQVRAGIRRIR